MADFDLAQALVDLSLGSKSQTASPAGPSRIEASTAVKVEPEEREPVTPPEADTTPQSSIKHIKRNETLVVLQDACYKHKFGRQIRQRDLDTIVERPERTRAAVLGIVTAKARLEQAALPSLDIVKSERRGWLGDAAVEAVHGNVYPQDLLKMSREASDKLKDGKLEVPDHLPWGDLYLGTESLDAINGCIGATYDGVDALFSSNSETTASGSAYRRCHVCIRPPGHHAAETAPCGFCWINNVHVGIAYAQAKYGVKRAVILDIDLHHGDGSQAMAWTLNETNPDSIAYYSLHDIYSYPCEVGNVEKIREASVSISAHGHNIHNVHLRTYTTEQEFDSIYERDYKVILHKARAYLEEGKMRGEKALVVISAGYDASEYESTTMQRHKVNVPTSFYERFTRDTVQLADELAEGKVLSVMEGGYGDRAITSAACSHMLGLAVPGKLEGDSDLRAAYALPNLQLLEKHFPSKVRGNRKPLPRCATLSQSDSQLNWLAAVEQLYEEYVPDSFNPVAPASLDAAAGLLRTPVSSGTTDLQLDMGRMTLRERKPKPSPQPTPSAAATHPRQAARAVTPRSTPVRRGKATVHPDSIPPLPVQAAANLHLQHQQQPDIKQPSLASAVVEPRTPMHGHTTPALIHSPAAAHSSSFVDSPTPAAAGYTGAQPQPPATPGVVPAISGADRHGGSRVEHGTGQAGRAQVLTPHPATSSMRPVTTGMPSVPARSDKDIYDFDETAED
ncbi:histone deacetylase [Savitreella phatthalungensis]